MSKQIQTEFDWFAQRTDEASVMSASQSGSGLGNATLPEVEQEKKKEEAPSATTRPLRRSPAVLPVPKPLASAIGRGHFGEDQNGPVRPTAAEVRAITESHAERLINLLDGLAEVERFLARSVCSDRARLYHEKDRLLSAYQGAIAIYAEDFGEHAARRLDAYARHQIEQRR